jgi:4-hydroxy-3-methylbut-2-enyl diphosphate reductase
MNQIPPRGAGTVLIRAHGVPPDTQAELEKAGFSILDATCPRVVKIQRIIRKFAKQNHSIIIVGDEDHPEVVGLLGYADGNGLVVSSLAQLQNLPALEKAIVVAQTTQSTAFFDEVKQWILKHYPQYHIIETICDATEKRQRDVKRLTESVDAILVVGGANSGNTRRLVEIAEQSGKPVYHVETETDVEGIGLEQLAASPSIGVTAGASTPNWIIKKVYRALEQLPYKKRRGWRRHAFVIQRVLLLTNIYVALGAGCLTFACIRLLGITDYLPFIVMAVLYVLSMHTLNHLIGTGADKYNDPDRAAFYEKYTPVLTLMAVAAGGAGLMTALTFGAWPFLILLIMSVTGLSYNLKLWPESISEKKYRRIRDIPGSKSILISVAWGVLAAVLPPIAVYEKITWMSFFLVLWSIGLVFVRTTFFDILDMQGDRIIGRETMAIILGEKTTMRLLEAVLIGLVVTLPPIGAIWSDGLLGSLLALCPLVMLVILSVFKNGYLLPGIRLEFLVETVFILAGFLTALTTLIVSA